MSDRTHDKDTIALFPADPDGMLRVRCDACGYEWFVADRIPTRRLNALRPILDQAVEDARVLLWEKEVTVNLSRVTEADTLILKEEISLGHS